MLIIARPRRCLAPIVLLHCLHMQNPLDLLIPAAQAHEKWFIDASTRAYPVPDFFVTWNPVTMSAVTAIVAALLLGLLADGWFERSGSERRLEDRIRPLRDYAAGALAFTTGIVLLVAAVKGTLLADDLLLPVGPVGMLLRGAEAAVGVSLLFGLFSRPAAGALFALWAIIAPIFGPVSVFEYAPFAGIAAFLFAFARSRYSLDWFLGKPILSTAEQRKRSYLVLRLATGAAFLSLAIGKWSRPDLHLALMDAHPDFNPYAILSSLGIVLSRETYVFLLAAVEALTGLLVFAGIIIRFAAIALAPLFVASVVFLGPLEIVGHLPILGILFVLFVFGDRYHKGGVEGSSVQVVK